MMRGINRQQIFWDLLDYQKFLKTLQDLPLRDQQEGELVGPLFKVYAYCLMGNHVHLLIQAGKVIPSNGSHLLMQVTTIIGMNVWGISFKTGSKVSL